MTNIILSGKNEIQNTNTLQTKTLQLKETMLRLIKFDTQFIDNGKIIYFRKKDCATPDQWFSVIVDGLKLYESFPEVRFNAEITTANYCEESQSYVLCKHDLSFIKGRDLVAHCFNSFRDIDFSDIVRIDAISAVKFGTKHRISAIFVRNDVI